MTQSKYEIRTNKKKQQIISATLELLRQKSYTDISIKEIAGLANVSQVSIYNYFESKNGLLVACIEQIANEHFEHVLKLLKSDLPYMEKLEKAFHICSASPYSSFLSAFGAHSLEEEKFLTIVKQGLKEPQRKVYAAYVEEGKKEQVINPLIPTDYIVNYIDHFNSIPLDDKDKETALAYYEQLLLNGLLRK